MKGGAGLMAGWSGVLLNLNSTKDEKIFTPNSGGRFLISRLYCLRQCGYNDFAVAAPGGNPSLFTIVTVRESSSPWACPGSHSFAYYPTVTKYNWRANFICKR